MVKKEPIRRKDKELCDRALLERWLYGDAVSKDASEGPEASTGAHLVGSVVPNVGLLPGSPSANAIATTSPCVIDGDEGNLLNDVMVLEVTPFSRANKCKDDKRDPVVWNQIWGLVSITSSCFVSCSCRLRSNALEMTMVWCR